MDIARDANFYVKAFCWGLYAVVAIASLVAIISMWLDNGGQE